MLCSASQRAHKHKNDQGNNKIDGSNVQNRPGSRSTLVASLFSEEDEYGEEDGPIMNSLFTQFLADSETQLILDMDFFKHFFSYAEAYRDGAEEGNLDLMRYVVTIVNKLKEFDVSSACLSDIMHYALTAVEYATHVDEHRNCTDCKCTPFFQQKKNERQWIFNGNNEQERWDYWTQWEKYHRGSLLAITYGLDRGILAERSELLRIAKEKEKYEATINNSRQLWKGMYCLAHLEAYERNNPLKALNQAGRVDAHCYKETNSSLPEDDDAKCFSLIPMLNFAVRLAESAAGREAVCDVEVECRNESKENSMSSSSLAMAALYFLTYTIIMMVFGTLYDLFIYQKENDNILTARRNNRELTINLRYLDWFLRMILAYSVYTNGLEVLQTSKKEGEVDCLHGIRFLSMCWIILGHTYYYIGTSLTTDQPKSILINENNSKQIEADLYSTDNLIPTLVNFPKSFYTQIIVQAPLAVDSFFLLRFVFQKKFAFLRCRIFNLRFSFVIFSIGKSFWNQNERDNTILFYFYFYTFSGLLASYIFFKKLIKDKTIRSATNPLMWLIIYIKRYTRITPTYAVIMLFDVTLFTYVSSGPFWRPIEKQGCRISWWTNFLYMNNFLLQDKECVSTFPSYFPRK
ncbi:unnamed protein product [Angiostrongylus costaricensis]|uniref:Nose resistant to fluoxetine protein 6 n=1 Tax=Angiostrongylus costaricensis TaxID=334426 RepID=A0A158PF08_ANGCS|nr:unnamed protein product [Angiostrongylus costaricensis]